MVLCGRGQGVTLLTLSWTARGRWPPILLSLHGLRVVLLPNTKVFPPPPFLTARGPFSSATRRLVSLSVWENNDVLQGEERETSCLNLVK